MQELDSLQKPPEYRFAPKPAEAAAPADARVPASPPPTRRRRGSGRHGPADDRDQRRDRALARAGDADEAIAAYEAILAKMPGDPARALQPRARATRRRATRPEGPGGLCSNSVELDPRFVGTATSVSRPSRRVRQARRGDQGRAGGRRREPAERTAAVRARRAGGGRRGRGTAEEAFLKAEQLDPQNVETQYHLATVALNHNDKPEAIARLEKFIAAAPAGAPTVDVAKSLLAALQKK